MIYLKLFLTFFEIGAVSFGGGYGMLSLMRELVVQNGWLTDNEMLNFIAVSESTPGPIAINMATFVGSSQGGIFGSFCATLGVVLPAFVIILIIASVANAFMKKRGVTAFLGGVKPCVVALIIGTAVTMGLKALVGVSTVKTAPSFDFRAIIILCIIVGLSLLIKYAFKKKPKPILLIVISAVLGIVMYSL